MGAEFKFGVNVSSGSGNLDYVVQDVECDVNTDPATITGTPLAATQTTTSTRGTWNHDAVSLSNSNNTYGGSGTYYLPVPYDNKNSPAYAAANSWDSSNAVTNLWLWGVIVHAVVCLTQINPGSCTAESADLSLYASDTSNYYAGALDSGNGSGLQGIGANGSGTFEPIIENGTYSRISGYINFLFDVQSGTFDTCSMQGPGTFAQGMEYVLQP